MHLQYVLSRPDSSLVLLTFLTGFLIIFGGISLYIVSKEETANAELMDVQNEAGSKESTFSFGEAMWAAAEGAGRQGFWCLL